MIFADLAFFNLHGQVVSGSGGLSSTFKVDRSDCIAPVVECGFLHFGLFIFLHFKFCLVIICYCWRDHHREKVRVWLKDEVMQRGLTVNYELAH